MNNQYCFDKKSFSKIFLTRSFLIWAIVSGFLNLLAAQNGTWSIGLWAIVAAITLLPVLGMYVNRRLMWKSAYVQLHDTHAVYFRLIKNGYQPDSTAYEYEARETIIYSVSQCRVSNGKLYITGNIRIRIYKDQDHQKVVEKTVREVRIPMYFENSQEMIRKIQQYR